MMNKIQISNTKRFSIKNLGKKYFTATAGGSVCLFIRNTDDLKMDDKCLHPKIVKNPLWKLND